MHIILSGHHVDITDALRQYVSSKMERLERHFDSVTDIHVVLSVEKMRQKAEATLHLSGNKLFADATVFDGWAVKWQAELTNVIDQIFGGEQDITIKTIQTINCLQHARLVARIEG